MIETTPHCVHCGVALLYPGHHWCAQCQRDARDNHGVCTYCHRDLTDWANCWPVRRVLDQTAVKANIPFMGGCPSCQEHRHIDAEMEIVELVVTTRMKYLRMVCTVCQTRCETRYDLRNPPPQTTSGKPPWDPDG